MKFYCLMLVVLSGVATSQAAHWSYGSDDTGPLNWHELFPEACSGKHQSPINIHPDETTYNRNLKDFAIWYDPPRPNSKMYIGNNGHTVQVDLEGDFYVSNGGLSYVYKALQFHFHWGHKAHHGSEHLLDGKPSPIELHLVTYNHELYSDVGQAVKQKGGLAVLGTMYEISEEDNPTLTTLVEALKHVRNPEHKDKADLPLTSLRNFLPKDLTRYYRYNGSLTTPGCFESVIWTIFDEKQKISHKQLKEFTTLLQFKHKHVKGKKADGRRHRRSMSKASREKEHRAENVLFELGIKGNEFEEAIFQSELMQEKMMADMPLKDAEINISESSPTPKGKFSQKSALEPSQKHEMKSTLDEEKVAIIDMPADKHTGANDNTKTKTASSRYNHGDEVVETEEHFYVQEVIVNNFRPIQPLNDRTVYRSFKYIQTVTKEDDETAKPGSRRGKNNGADHHKLSLSAVTIICLVSLFFI